MMKPCSDRVLDFSASFVLSSGTVSIDCSKGLVLILYYRPKEEYLLPKGRKMLVNLCRMQPCARPQRSLAINVIYSGMISQ